MSTFFAIDVQSGSPAGRRLVVILHGFAGAALKAVEAAVRESLPEADILSPGYKTKWLMKENATVLADELSELIQAQCRSHEEASGLPYDDIVLIGHSMGALLLRKAFVFALGESQDLRVAGLRRGRQPWAKKRITDYLAGRHEPRMVIAAKAEPDVSDQKHLPTDR